jgi:hypothetical protein
MKKIYTFFVLIFVSLSLNSQTIPNAGFENWTNMFIYQTPDSWTTLNFLAATGGTAPVTKSTDAHSGSYAAKCETVLAQFDTFPAEVVPGFVMLGDFNFLTQTGNIGAPFTARPDSMIFWMKSSLIGGDTVIALLQLSKWNSLTGSQDLVGIGQAFYTNSYTTYHRYSIPVSYIGATIPDSINIGFVGGSTQGSYFLVDDVSLIYNTSDVKELADDAKSFDIYPNPANDDLSIRVQNDENVEIVNSLGVRMSSLKLKKGIVNKLPTDNYSNGLYFIKSSSGNTVKFIVRH